MKSLLAMFLVLLVPAAYGQTSPQQPEAPATNQYKSRVDGVMAPLLAGPSAVRGLVAGIVYGGRREVWGYGKAGRKGETPNGESLFQIASATKPLTALLLAQMVAEGKVNYDDVAITFKGKPVTYRQLVTHTSGLPVLPPQGVKYRDGSLKEFCKFLSQYSLPHDPGSRFEYSVFGYSVLGLCLAGKCEPNTFETGLTRNILTPLGMSSTAFQLRKNDEPRFAGYALPEVRLNGPSPANPSGGLISSADDLLQFISANLQPESQPALAKALVLTQQISTPAMPTFPGSVAALGWEVINIGPAKYYWGSGTGPGMVFITFDPASHTGVVILTSDEMQPFDTRMPMAGFSLLGALANTKPE